MTNVLKILNRRKYLIRVLNYRYEQLCNTAVAKPCSNGAVVCSVCNLNLLQMKRLQQWCWNKLLYVSPIFTLMAILIIRIKDTATQEAKTGIKKIWTICVMFTKMKRIVNAIWRKETHSDRRQLWLIFRFCFCRESC